MAAIDALEGDAAASALGLPVRAAEPDLIYIGAYALELQIVPLGERVEVRAVQASDGPRLNDLVGGAERARSHRQARSPPLVGCARARRH